MTYGLAIVLNDELCGLPFPATQMRHQSRGYRARWTALIGLPRILWPPDQHTRVDVEPAAPSAGHPLRAQDGRVPRAGVERHQNKASEMPVDALLVALAVRKTECCPQQRRHFGAGQIASTGLSLWR